MSLISEACDLLFPLVQGVDPRTGAVLAADHLCTDPVINRALVVALTVLEQEVRHQPPPPPRERQGHRYDPWTTREDDELRAEAAAHWSLKEMVRTHQRTRGAIRSRLRRLDLVETLPQPTAPAVTDLPE